MSTNYSNNEEPEEKKRSLITRILLKLIFLFVGLGVICLLLAVFAIAIAYPNLPEIDAITDYRPKMPLRIYTADNVLIGEYGEERRNVLKIQDIPEVMKKAILAVEDSRFYQHKGVDYFGIFRAAVNNVMGRRMQGASTITQQVARNFLLSNERTIKRKFYEILLAKKIENELSKDEILEVYMNQIYLGQRAFGFASAAQIYFGKKLKDVTLAEAAMLAGLPKAPSANNPVANPTRARTRQLHVLDRMYALGYISTDEYQKAKNEEIHVKIHTTHFPIHAEYVAETVRMLAYTQYKEDTYTRGLNVHTTIISAEQEAAYRSLRKHVMNYEKRQRYRGPEGFISLPSTKEAIMDAVEAELEEHPASDDLLPAVVLESSSQRIKAMLASGEEIEIIGKNLDAARSGLSGDAPRDKKIRPGAIIRVKHEDKNWIITQLPMVEAAFVAVNTADGAIRAMIGGFDFNRNKFNHVTQAWRQPGSSFKPFIYSASLEKGLSPATIINDAPITFTQPNGRSWSPKNYGGNFSGPMTMRSGLTYSKNTISVRVMHQIGATFAKEYAMRFGFDSDKNPAYLTLALGAGSVTPLQMASAYSIFANGGYKVNPYLISKITDSNGNILSEAQPETAGNESLRVIDARNAFIMDSMMKDVVRRGTAARAGVALGRADLAGKTGTTNNAYDAWFAGYQYRIAAVAWMGYDHPQNLGSRETGGGLALPIWIDYMRTALKSIPVEYKTVPKGIVRINDEYFYSETPPGATISKVGVEEDEKSEERAAPGELPPFDPDAPWTNQTPKDNQPASFPKIFDPKETNTPKPQPKPKTPQQHKQEQESLHGDIWS